MKEILLGSGIDPKPTIEKHQETAEWEYREEAKFWYGVAKEMDKRFFNGLVYPDGKKVPTPVIAFDDLRNNNTLACYALFPDEYGILGKITFNTEQYNQNKEWSYGRYSQGETLLHEYIHLWQQLSKRAKDPFNQRIHGRNTHNKEFVTKAEELGIHPLPNVGCHTRIATEGSPIDILLREQGIVRPEVPEGIEGTKISWQDWIIVSGGGEKRKGTSTLHKWECPECHLKVRVGVKDNPYLMHIPCSMKTGKVVMFVNKEAGIETKQTVYQAKEPGPEKKEPEKPIVTNVDGGEVPYWDPDSERNQRELERERGENYDPTDDPEDLSNYLYF